MFVKAADLENVKFNFRELESRSFLRYADKTELKSVVYEVRAPKTAITFLRVT